MQLNCKSMLQALDYGWEIVNNHSRSDRQSSSRFLGGISMRVVFFNLLGWLLLALQVVVAFLGHGLHSFYCCDQTCLEHDCRADHCGTDSHHADHCVANKCSAHSTCEADGSCADSSFCRNNSLRRKTVASPALRQPLSALPEADKQAVGATRKPIHDANCAICHLLALGQLKPDRLALRASYGVTSHTPFPPDSPVLAARYAVALPRSPPRYPS